MLNGSFNIATEHGHEFPESTSSIQTPFMDDFCMENLYYNPLYIHCNPL